MSCSCTGDSCAAAPAAPAAPERVRSETRRLAIRFSLSFAIFACALTLSLIPRAPSSWTPWITAAFVLSWALSGYRVVFNALRNLSKGQLFDENFLMTTATVGAFAISQNAEAAAVMLFYNLGELIQESAVAKSRKSITDLVDVRSETARLASGETVPAASVVPGAVILVHPGERVPLDGIVLEGQTSFDTAALTGESLPRSAGPGDEALAGFMNGGGALTLRVTAAFGDTAASRMLALIEESRHRKAPAERFITSFARYYTPAVTLGALAIAFLIPLILQDAAGPRFSLWIPRALVFLVISCPCAFVISVPLGYFGGIGGAARRGILVKGSDFLDALSRTKTVVFDKTGTLTTGRFSVTALECAPGVSEGELLSAAAAVEARSTHPLAEGIRREAESRGVGAGSGGTLSDYGEKPGYGAACVRDGVRLLGGNPQWLREEMVTVPESSESPAPGSASVEVARDGKWIGRILLADTVKPSAAKAVGRLRALGIDRVAMITGDSAGAASRVAGVTGIAETFSGVLPHQKAELFSRIREETLARHPKGVTVFAGDGLNDAAVLALADVGMSMGSLGSDAAVEASDVVLMNDDPESVAEAVVVARKTRRVVAENVILAFAVKLGFLALGAFGIATLWEAVFADVGVALLATANAVRSRRA